jgi:hypothetical protein
MREDDGTLVVLLLVLIQASDTPTMNGLVVVNDLETKTTTAATKHFIFK